MPEGASNATAPILPLPGLDAPPLGEWHGHGLCAGEDPDVFFPSHTDPGTRAREICGACPVRSQCLDYATEADEFGIWAGLDQQERRNLRRRQRRRLPAGSREREVAGEAV